MQIIHALQPLSKSIFLAGPTPRDAATASWRPEALQLLEQHGFDGTVFVPEAPDWAAHDNYNAQVHWEWEALDQASVVLFWIPREIGTMPAFTTNVEFGLHISQGRCIIGHPEKAPKTAYLDALARRYHTPVYVDLETTVMAAIGVANTRHDLTLRGWGTNLRVPAPE